MRSLLIAALALATMAGVANATRLPASPAPVAFGDWPPDSVRLYTAHPLPESLSAWRARAVTMRARPAQPFEADQLVDTATTHLRLDIARLLVTFPNYRQPPIAAEVVDLDGNAFPEVVSISSAMDSLTIHTDVAADFVEHLSRVPLPGDGFGLAVGDVDGDGHSDVVCSSYSTNGLVILRGLGAGALAPALVYPTGVTPLGLALADLDGDGDLDVAVACAGDSSVHMMRNRGDGTFEDAGALRVGAGPVSVIAKDVTGDGLVDLVSMDQDAFTLSCLVGLGGGAFAPAATSAVPGMPFGIAAADLDDDGRVDIAMSGYLGSRVLLGDGTGHFTPGTVLSSRVDRMNGGVAIADLDGDGRLDVATGEAGVRGSGAFAYFGAVRIHRALGGGRFETMPGYRTVGGLQSISLGDVDRDGLLDLLAVGTSEGFINQVPGVSVLYGRPDHRWRGLLELGLPLAAPVSYWSALHSASALHLDGALEDLVAVTDGRIMLMVNRGERGFAPATQVGTGDILAVRDLDGDGRDDVVIQDASTLGVLRGAPGHTLVPGAWTQPSYTFLALGRFDADAFPDLIVRDAPGNLLLARGVGDGGFGVPAPTGPALPYEPWLGQPGGLAGNGVDLDRDGIDELALFRVRNSTAPEIGDEHAPDTVEVYRALPGGTLTSIAKYAVPWPTGSKYWYDAPHQILSGDFDGDGWPDLMAFRWGPSAPGTRGSYGVLMNQGGSTMALSEVDWVSIEASEAAVADLDGDLRDDMVISVVHSDDTGELAWLVSRGDGTFASGSRNDVGDFLNSIGVGHFDDDPRPDVTITSGRDICLDVLMNATPWQDFDTPVLASLVSASIEAGTAHLAWRVDDASAEAIVLRSDGGATWAERARLRPAGDGSVRFDDAGLTPGAHVGYRLALLERGALVTASETWLDVPAAAQLALVGASPNPVAGDLNVAFSLAERTRGTLALFDLAGRRLAEHDLSALAAGEHRVRLASAGTIAPGLYFIRLVTPQHTLTTRAIVVD